MDTMLVHEVLHLEVRFHLEGHDRWTGDMSLHIYSQKALWWERAKAVWMVKNIQHTKKEGRMVLNPTPADG